MLRRQKGIRALVCNQVTFERGSAALVQGPRIAVVAHWSTGSRVTRSVSALVHELQTYGYRVVVSSACEAPLPLEWDETVDDDELIVLRKPNLGYDFGSWTTALGLLPQTARAERLLLVNDSMAGPFRSLRPLLEQFDATRVDVWGLTDTQQFGKHLQSYWLGFCDAVLSDLPLNEFWTEIRHEPDKSQIILRYEVGLGRLLREEGYIQGAAFPHERYIKDTENPVIIGWRRLLDDGFPFLKREILRDPSVAPNGDDAPAAIEELFGVDVASWVDDG